MKTYAIYFNGYYPVGAVAVVTAENEDRAREICNSHLEHIYGFKDNIADVKELDVINENVNVLLDGDY